jgi:hypothetical protein
MVPRMTTHLDPPPSCCVAFDHGRRGLGGNYEKHEITRKRPESEVSRKTVDVPFLFISCDFVFFVVPLPVFFLSDSIP